MDFLNGSIAVPAPAGGSGLLSGLGDLFGNIGNSIASVYTAVNGPSGTPVPGVPGAVFPRGTGGYSQNPLTGTTTVYAPVQQGFTLNMNTLLLIGAALLAAKYLAKS